MSVQSNPGAVSHWSISRKAYFTYYLTLEDVLKGQFT